MARDLPIFLTRYNEDRENPEELKAFADAVSYSRAVLADASSEDQHVEAAQHCSIGCNRLTDRRTENFDRQLRSLIASAGRGFKIAHV